MTRKVHVHLDDRHFIVSFNEEKGTALVMERVPIYDGKRRRYHVDQSRWFYSDTLPQPNPDPLGDRVMKEARSKL